ncbi:WD40 repeat-like protein [Mycena albidolilacea]|uniref:WD40 repeat-like protein n=1 Tax=Mycena albidolilacea TaxID=1033008 RepID=A0AAD7AK95_9AGAR|nr:WD40 repeat-like protein [Mycena albidolilacea]
MADGPPVIRMTADEINCLVYAFLVDSGFKHSAFSLCMESRLENSPNFSKHIPRGELIDLLSKSLLYREVESHWKADHLALNCKAGFSLLEAHVCSLDPPKPKSVPLSLTYTQWPLGHSNRNGVTTDGKRKASPTFGVDGPAEKRARRDADDMDTDLYRSSESSAKKPKPKLPRQPGPADSETNPNAILTLPNETEVFVCGFNPANQSILVTGSKDAVLTLWDLPNPPLPGSAEFAQPPGAPRRLEFGGSEHCDLTALHWNVQGTLVAVGSYDSVLRICSVSGELYFSHTQHEGPIFAVRFSKDGKWLLTASLDNTVCLWDVNAKELNAQYRTHTDCCLDIDWLSDILFGTCSADHLIHIMQVGKAEPLKTFSGHTHEVNQIKSNPSATRLASCSDDMTARIWRLDDISAAGEVISGVGEPQLAVLSGHSNSVSTIGWCPNTPAGTNEIVATAAFDATCRLWDSVTGECLKTFEDHKRPVYALKFNPTGRWLATGSGDGWLHIYDVKERGMRWSWFAGYEKPGVFEIDWQTSDNLDRIALALERNVAVIDVSKLPALQRK